MPEQLVRPFLRHVSVAGAIMLAIVSPAFGDQYQRQPGVDVRHYAFKLELKDGTHVVSGETDIDVLFNADGVRQLFLDLVGPSSDGNTGMTVGSVDSGGATLAFTHEHNRIRIDLVLRLAITATIGFRQSWPVALAQH